MAQEDIKNFINKLETGDNAGAGEHFKSALADKVGFSLDDRRKEIASTLMTQPAEMPTNEPEVATDGTESQ